MRNAVVTGAGQGLGKEIARALARRGVAVHVTDLDGDAAESAAAEIGAGARGSALDVTDAGACETIARGTREADGTLDLWVNNAGVLVTGFSWEQDEATRDLMMRVNATGTMNGTVAALGEMVPAGRGHVLNVVSLAGLVAAPGEVSYAASKHAAIAFSIGTQYDLRRAGHKGIRISCLCPDGIWTPMLHDKLDDPDAAASFSGVLLPTSRVAEEAAKIAFKPKMVTVVPRWRGAVLRLLDAFPGAGLRAIPFILKDARRRQAAYKRKAERGEL